MKIGNIELGKVILAPMTAVNCPSFRLLCESYGVDLLTTQTFWSWETDIWKKRLATEFAVKHTTPLSVQVGGNKPEELVAAVKALDQYADIFDFNAGCPLNDVCGKQSGAFLLLHLGQLERAIKEVISATDKPVTVKIRTGWDPKNITVVETARLIEECGAAAITVHARSRTDRYSVKANWKLIEAVKAAVNIPVIGNGDIAKPEDAERMLSKTGCDAVMVGRAAKGNPFLFKQIKDLLASGIFKTQSPKAKASDFLRFAESYHRLERDRSLSEFRDHALWFLKGMRQGIHAKKKVMRAQTIRDIEKVFRNV